ncbi:MAG: hypothetical protein EBU46_00240 [Nitrosomonadaceae bacterium]|nr:hypothetical protein [Nitrosomonadaceae bacterium]
MPDRELPTPAADASTGLTTEADSIALAEEQISAEVNAPNIALSPEQSAVLTDIQQRLLTAMQPFIGESLNAETVAQVQAEVDDLQEVRQSNIERDVLLPTPTLEELAAISTAWETDSRTATADRCNICGEVRCRHLASNTSSNNELLDSDFYISPTGIVYPVIDRLAASTLQREGINQRPTTVTATLFYTSYSQCLAHLEIQPNTTVTRRGTVYYRGGYWSVDSLTLSATYNGHYEVVLELTAVLDSPVSIPNVIPFPTAELSLSETVNGQLEWQLTTDSATGSLIGIAPNAWVPATTINSSSNEEPSTVLKKPRCSICNQRGCNGHTPKPQPAVDPEIFGVVVEQQGDTSYIQLTNHNTVIVHNSTNNNSNPIAIGSEVAINNDGQFYIVRNQYQLPSP